MNGSMTLVSVLAVCVGAVTRSRAGAFYQILNQQAGLLYRMIKNKHIPQRVLDDLQRDYSHSPVTMAANRS